MHDLTGVRYGRDAEIMKVENHLRRVAEEEGVAVNYEHRVVSLAELGDRIAVTVQRNGSHKQETIVGRMLTEATGGRFEAANSGPLERVPTTSSHFYVTAQYDKPAAHKIVYGAFDRKRDEALLFYRVDGGKGFITYFDLPVGRDFPDEAALLARYDALAGQLNLGIPVSPPQVFDAMQHVSRSASSGHILKIGDSAGNADPYIGAGVAAALVDAQTATRALTAPGDTVVNARGAAEAILDGHRALGWQAERMRDARPVAMRTLRSAPLDETLRESDLKTSLPFEATARFISSLPLIS